MTDDGIRHMMFPEFFVGDKECKIWLTLAKANDEMLWDAVVIAGHFSLSKHKGNNELWPEADLAQTILISRMRPFFLSKEFLKPNINTLPRQVAVDWFKEQYKKDWGDNG